MAYQPTVGEWRFDVDGGALTQPGCVRRLEDRAARTLALLCRRRGEVVSKAEILEEVWHGRSVSSNSVAIVIADLRRALGENARSPQFIETVGKRGYRLSGSPQGDLEPMSAVRPGRSRRTRMLSGGITAVAAVSLAILTRAGQPARPVTLVLASVRNDTGQARYDPLAKALTALVEERVAAMPGVSATEVGSPARTRHAGRRLEMKTRLIIWNDTPTLSLSAVDLSDGRVAWSGMAVGRPDAIAGVTIAKLGDLRQHL